MLRVAGCVNEAVGSKSSLARNDRPLTRPRFKVRRSSKQTVKDLVSPDSSRRVQLAREFSSEAGMRKTMGKLLKQLLFFVACLRASLKRGVNDRLLESGGIPSHAIVTGSIIFCHSLSSHPVSASRICRRVRAVIPQSSRMDFSVAGLASCRLPAVSM